MDIGEVAKTSRVATSTLRYYEEKGLIKPLGRNGLRRFYAPEILQTLALITLGRNVGLSLDEIGEMLVPKGVKINHAQLLAKAEELDKKNCRDDSNAVWVKACGGLFRSQSPGMSQIHALCQSGRQKMVNTRE